MQASNPPVAHSTSDEQNAPSCSGENVDVATSAAAAYTAATSVASTSTAATLVASASTAATLAAASDTVAALAAEASDAVAYSAAVQALTSFNSLCESRDRETFQVVQLQLMLLIHADKCRNRNLTGGEKRCDIINCDIMKEALNHFDLCHAVESCPVPHCAPSRKLILHWRECTEEDCPLCYPLRQISSPHDNNASTCINCGNATNRLSGPNNASSRKSWHLSIAPGLRQYIVQKLIQTVFTATGIRILRNARMSNLVTYAKKIESKIYEAATNKQEYFKLLHEKMDKIRRK